jgi:L-fuconolactonase
VSFRVADFTVKIESADSEGFMAVNERENWLAQVKEPVIEPELPIIDPHHHLWDYPNSRYMLDEIVGDTGSGHRVIATVFVECASMYRGDGPREMKPIGETEFVNGIAAQSASGRYGDTRVALGIVSFADLALGAAVEPVLRAHMAASPRFRGIRHAAAFDSSSDIRRSHTSPPPDLYQSKNFREGFAKLGALGLSFDAWNYHHQIPALTDLARAFPNVTIILDHFGGPLGIGPYEGKRAEIFAQWKKDIAELAKCQNVVAKLGGINMPVNGFGWHKRPKPATSDELVEATRDYYLHSIDQFGPKRCMFESNFPVDKASCSYAVLWNAFKKIAARFDAQEKRAMFHDTAARVYRLQSNS